MKVDSSTHIHGPQPTMSQIQIQNTSIKDTKAVIPIIVHSRRQENVTNAHHKGTVTHCELHFVHRTVSGRMWCLKVLQYGTSIDGASAPLRTTILRALLCLQ